MKKISIYLFALILSLAGQLMADTLTVGQETYSGDSLVLVKDGIAQYIIYYDDEESEIIKYSAIELATYMNKISGADFTVTTDQNAGSNLIVVGRNNPLTSAISGQMDFASMEYDGFRILTDNSKLYIAGAIDRGTMYGVYYLLDAYFGVRWFSPEFEVVPSQSTLSVSEINNLQNPRFMYREMFNGDTDDGYFRAHNRLNGNRFHRSDFTYEAGMDTWSEDGPVDAHNFHEIVSDPYHYGGQILAMDGNTRSQASEHFTRRILSEGDGPWYAFSQMDNSWSADESSESFADSHGGELSAPIVDMVANIADQVRQTYPNAHLSTLAYQWSFNPPTGLSIPEYVMVETAPIHADFGYPYNHVRNIGNTNYNQWNQVAATLSVWDYNANFQNYLQPLPNIYPMCENIKYFATLDAIKTYFGQGSFNTAGAEFAELRAWVASRLLWNPNQDYKVLINEFCDGYYGGASSYIKQYIDLMHQSVIDTSDRISIKQRITADYLNLDFILQADKIMALADAAATGEYSKHVHDVRLGVDMTILLCEHLYEADALEEGITWTNDSNRRARFDLYSTEALITYYNESSSIRNLYAAMDVNRFNPLDPDIIVEGDDWIDYQDLDYKICCDANIVEDLKASDHGAIEKGDNGDWAIQMSLDLLPTEGEWNLYAYARATGASDVAFTMGVYPGGTLSVSASEIQDEEYHVFEFPGGPFSFETGRHLWFSRQTGTMYIDRIVAVRSTDLKVRQ